MAAQYVAARRTMGVMEDLIKIGLLKINRKLCILHCRFEKSARAFRCASVIGFAEPVLKAEMDCFFWRPNRSQQ
jgi:hypothetical protein